jgi:hypothetical protein
MSFAHEVLAYPRASRPDPHQDHRPGRAFVGLHERAVILVSANALRLVNNEEFAAVIA